MRPNFTLFSFTYDIILVIVFTAVVSFALCLNLIRKRNIAIPVIGLYTFYLIDTWIIFMTEALPDFNAWYEEGFVYNPSMKTVIYIGIGFFTLYTWNVLLKRKFSHIQMIILVLLGLYLVLVPLMKGGAMKAWLYFTAYQVFTLLISIYGLWKLKRLNSEDYDGPFGWIRALLILTVIFSVLIAVEDSIVIFQYDSYIAGDLSIYSRNMSEDILRMIYTGFFFFIFNKQFRRNWFTAPEDSSPLSDAPVVEAEPAPEPEPEPAPLSSPEALEDYKRLKFAQQLCLTEREMEVFRQMLSGQTNQQISETLHISMGTVKAHIHNIFQKAGVTHRYELLRQYDAFTPELPV